MGIGDLVKVYAVESGGVFAHNLDLVLFRNVGEGALDDFLGVGESAFVVGVVAAPHEAVDAGELDIVKADGVVAEGDESRWS